MRPKRGGFRLRLQLNLEGKHPKQPSQGGVGIRARFHAAGHHLQTWAQGHRRGAIATALLLPLLLVLVLWGFLWWNGLVASPLLVHLTGHDPLAEEGPARFESDMIVTTPQNGETISGSVLFQGVTRPQSTVYYWEKGQNVPATTQTAATGVWTYQFNPASLSEGSHLLVFASTNGKTWSSLVERTVTIQHDASPSPSGGLLSIFRPVGEALRGGVNILAAATGLNLQNDVNQDGVPDWLQASVVSPVAIPAHLTPIIGSPAWFNLLILAIIVTIPLLVLIRKNPSWLGPTLNRYLALRAVDKDRLRANQLARKQLITDLEKDRNALQAGKDARLGDAKTNAQARHQADKDRQAALRIKMDAQKYAAQARAAAAASRAAGQTAVARTRREASLESKRADLRIAELAARRSPPTIINLGQRLRKTQGAFRGKRRTLRPRKRT